MSCSRLSQGVGLVASSAWQTQSAGLKACFKQTTSPTAVFNTATYTYDVLDNLATVNVTGGSQARNHTYVYDATSKRLSQVNNTVGGANVANLTYDVQGNLASKGPVSAVQTYVFDLGNRLRSVPNKETGYEYDGHGRRVYALTVGSSAILSQYANSGQVLYQENNKQSKRIDYIYLGNSLVAYRERPLASSTETLKYQHTDALGSPISVTDAAKVAIESSEYEPFGQLVNKPLFDGPGYTGHVQDAATGLTYMQQRYYDAGIGRFLSVDPVTAYSNPVGAFNRYWYANNNPYKFTDPDGRDSFLVSRPLKGKLLGGRANHNFIVHHADTPGDPNGTVRSYGDTGDDTMGEVTKDTKGFSEGTNESDRQAWESLIDSDGGAITYRKIDATDDVVKTNADALIGGDEYSAVPSVQGGVNSNSAAGAVAKRSDGGSSSVDNGRRQPGSEEKAVERVKFREEPNK